MTRFTPFILTGDQRSGSTLVEHSLRQHSQVRMYGEVLNSRRSRFDIDGKCYEDAKDGADYLRYLFSNRYPADIRAVGFKFFYSQAREHPDMSTAWQFVSRHRALKLIWMKRNWFAQLASLAAAEQSGVWWVPLAQPRQRPSVRPFEISSHKCEEYFSNQERWTRQLEKETREHEVLVIEYQDLCRSYLEVLHTLFDWLQLPRISPAMPTRKQRALEPHHQVSNYAELKSHFSGTRFAGHFVEP